MEIVRLYNKRCDGLLSLPHLLVLNVPKKENAIREALRKEVASLWAFVISQNE